MHEHSCYSVGAAAVAPSGVGGAFEQSLKEGRSGVVSISQKMAEASEGYLSILRPYTTHLDATPPPNKQLTQTLKLLAQQMNAYFTAVADGANAEEPPPFPPRFGHPPMIARPGAHKDCLDAFAAVLDDSLLPYLLPLQAWAFRNTPLEQNEAIDAYFNAFPRIARMSMVSTFLALLDTLGRRQELEEHVSDALRQHFAQPGHPMNSRGNAVFNANTLPAYLEATSDAFDEAMRAILGFTEQNTVGLVLGTAAGNVEVMAHYALQTDKFLKGGQLDFTDMLKDQKGIGPAQKLFYQVHMFNWMQQVNFNYTAALLCRLFRLSGFQLTVSTSCCSGLTGIVTATQHLSRAGDKPEYVVVTGTDSALWPELILGFVPHGLLATVPWEDVHDASRPYNSNALGWVLGEGAGSVVFSSKAGLHPVEHPSLRPASSISAMSIMNIMGNDPKAKQRVEVQKRSLEGRLGDHGLVIGYGLGDCKYDPAELHNIKTALKDKNRPQERVYLANLKAMNGHSMGCTSILAAVLGHRLLNGSIEPQALKLRLDKADLARKEGFTRVDDIKDEIEPLDWVLLNGSGLGGTTAALRMDRYPH